MTLSGRAALALFFDVDPQAIDEHDQWHTQEHFPERLSIPGFRRGTRWIALEGGPRYCVLYEVADVDVLTGAAYRERLDHPTPWTQKTMRSVRGMARGFCALRASFGAGLGNALLAARYAPAPGREDELAGWLERTASALCSRPGFASAHLLAPAARPPMTTEQSIRGRDADMPPLLLVCGYRAEAILRAAQEDLAPAKFAEHGAAECAALAYRLDHSLTAAELQQPG